MTRTVLLALSLVALTGAAAMAQAPFTSQEQAACRGDAMKLCSSAIGKPDQMKACLEQNKSSLSDACLKVVQSHGG